MPQSHAALACAEDAARPGPPCWEAQLDLAFARRTGGTVLARRGHHGPLQLQKILFPEGPEICHGIVIHPPGGIAGGDRLAIRLRAADRAFAQLTTPGAGKWYRSVGPQATLRVEVRVGRGAVVEWLPQENIYFDGAAASTGLEVDLDANGVYCGWELACLGRPGSDAPFRSGALRQRVRITREGRPLFREQSVLEASSPALRAETGLGGRCAFGTLVVAGAQPDRSVIERAREVAASCPFAGVTAMERVLVVRWVGDRIEEGRALFTSVWASLRPWYAGRMAVVPRIWST